MKWDDQKMQLLGTKTKNRYMYIYDLYTLLYSKKLTQHCKTTIFQFKKIKTNFKKRTEAWG